MRNGVVTASIFVLFNDYDSVLTKHITHFPNNIVRDSYTKFVNHIDIVKTTGRNNRVGVFRVSIVILT